MISSIKKGSRPSSLGARWRVRCVAVVASNSHTLYCVTPPTPSSPHAVRMRHTVNVDRSASVGGRGDGDRLRRRWCEWRQCERVDDSGGAGSDNGRWCQSTCPVSRSLSQSPHHTWSIEVPSMLLADRPNLHTDNTPPLRLLRCARRLLVVCRAMGLRFEASANALPTTAIAGRHHPIRHRDRSGLLYPCPYSVATTLLVVHLNLMMLMFFRAKTY